LASLSCLPFRYCPLQGALRPSKPTRSNVIPLTISGETYPRAQLPGLRMCDTRFCKDPKSGSFVLCRPSRETRDYDSQLLGLYGFGNVVLIAGLKGPQPILR
jgi:hypothetical protein